jgi:hypothetical protein
LEGNGHAVELKAVKAEQADLRDEIRDLRVEMKALRETMRDTGRAVDTLITELRLRDESDE